MNPALYLASQSPRRRELLQQIGVHFAVIDVSVLEQGQPNELPAEYVCRLAAEKARAGGEYLCVQERSLAHVPVLGADTVVVLNGQILEKPVDALAARNMLLALSGCEHQVFTAVSFYTPARQQTLLSVTDVAFRTITAAEADAYWLTGEPRDKAGGYGIQGLGAVFVTGIRGSYTGVVGLPIEQTYRLLNEFDVPVWQHCAASQSAVVEQG